MRSGTRLIIWYAICLHCLWAVLLLWNGAAMGATPVHVYTAVPRWLFIAVLLTASGLAVYGVTGRRRSRLALVALLPQQALLTISAAASVGAVAVSHYGDGVIRPRAFILADQAPVILAMLLHTAAVTAILVRANRLSMMGNAIGAVREDVDRLSAGPQDLAVASGDLVAGEAPGRDRSEGGG